MGDWADEESYGGHEEFYDDDPGPNGLWKMVGGETIWIADMSDSHLANTIKMLTRKGIISDKLSELRLEQLRRKCREEPVTPETKPSTFEEWEIKSREILRLLVELRDALPAISTTSARVYGVKLDLADRVEECLRPWVITND